MVLVDSRISLRPFVTPPIMHTLKVAMIIQCTCKIDSKKSLSNKNRKMLRTATYYQIKMAKNPTKNEIRAYPD